MRRKKSWTCLETEAGKLLSFNFSLSAVESHISGALDKKHFSNRVEITRNIRERGATALGRV
jgi:hypothetical protein